MAIMGEVGEDHFREAGEEAGDTLSGDNVG
jgi:hypothetical protein